MEIHADYGGQIAFYSITDNGDLRWTAISEAGSKQQIEEGDSRDILFIRSKRKRTR